MGPTKIATGVQDSPKFPTKIQEQNAFSWDLVHAEILWGSFDQDEEDDPEYEEPCSCVKCRQGDPDNKALDRSLEEAIERGEPMLICDFCHRPSHK